MLVVKYLSAVWCGPCKAFKPIVNEVCASMSGKVQLQQLDVDTAGSQIADLRITSVPTMILYKNGVEVHRTSGVQSKQSLKALLERYA